MTARAATPCWRHPACVGRVPARSAKRQGRFRGGEARGRGGESMTAPLVRFTPAGGGTFTRASEASYYTQPPNETGGFLAWAASNVIREDRRDGVAGGYLFEPSRTNYARYSEALDDAAWVKTACSISSAAGVAPDGEADCRTISFTADAAAECRQLISSTANSSSYMTSFWARHKTGSGNIRLSVTDRAGVVVTSADQPISQTWKMINPIATVPFYLNWGVAGPGTPSVAIVNGSAGAAQDVEIWGVQVEFISSANTAAPASYIRTVAAAVTRAADLLVFASSPSTMRGGRWTMRIAPTYANTDTNTGGVTGQHTVFGFHATNDDAMKAEGATLGAYVGGTNRFTKAVGTYSRDQIHTHTVDLPSAKITIAGYTTNDGVGAVGLVPTFADGYLSVGSRAGVASTAWTGRIWEPVAIQPTPSVLGFDNFSSSKFFNGGALIPGDAAGFGVALAVHVRSTPSGAADYLIMSGSGAIRGWSLRMGAGPALSFQVANGVGALILSPTSAIGAADIGKTLLFVGVFTGAVVRLYRAGVQVGAGTAIVGYTPPTGADVTSIGISNTGEANSLRWCGAVVFTGVPTLADIAAWGEATKAAGAVQQMGGAGVVNTNRWRPIDSPTAPNPWVDDIGSLSVPRTGIIVPVPFTPAWE